MGWDQAVFRLRAEYRPNTLCIGTTAGLAAILWIGIFTITAVS
jgi:hypothetical protein